VVQQFVLPRVSIQIGHVSVSIGSEDTSVDGISVDGTSSEPACMRWSAGSEDTSVDGTSVDGTSVDGTSSEPACMRWRAAASAGQSGERLVCPIVLHAEQRGAARGRCVAVAI
jgi:hypothetical protein